MLILLTTRSVVKPVMRLVISFLKPSTILTVKNITETPKAMPIIPIFTIGLEMFPLSSLGLEILSAINFSIFKKRMYLRYKNNKLPGFIACLILLSSFLSAQNFSAIEQKHLPVKEYKSVTLGAQQFDSYLPLLKNKRIAIVTNVTGVINSTSIVDTLIKLKVNVK